MVEDRTPKYCSICGTRLVALNITKGFDPFTGEAEEIQNLQCPNPTVRHSTFKKEFISHPSWSNASGVWDQT